MIISANAWGRETRGIPPSPGVVTHMTVHWVGSKNYSVPKGSIATGIKAIERSQFAKSPTLGAISYNFLVDKWGRVWEGRGFAYRNAANGASANNATSMSVCVLVGINDATVTPEILSGLQSIYRAASTHFQQNLLVQGHQEVRSTQCPGPELMAAIRSGQISSGGNVVRLSGSDRFDTAVAISRMAFPNGSTVVYIANGVAFADSLPAGPASSVKPGPLLYVNRDSIPASTRAELSRLKPKTIYILGGDTVISPVVEKQLASFAS